MAAGFKVGLVNPPDEVGASGIEDLRAVFLPAKVLQRQIGALNLGAHGAINNDDTFGHEIEDMSWHELC